MCKDVVFNQCLTSVQPPVRPLSLTPLDRLNVVGVCSCMRSSSRRTGGQALHCYFCSSRLNDIHLVMPCISMSAPGFPNPARQGANLYKRLILCSQLLEGENLPVSISRGSFATRSIATQASPSLPNT